MRAIARAPSPTTVPPTRSASSFSVPNIAVNEPLTAGRRRCLLGDVERFLDVAGDVDAAIADTLARHDELQLSLLGDLGRRVANLLRELFRDFRVFLLHCERRAQLLSAIAPASRNGSLVGQKLVLVVLVFGPVRDDALHVDQSDRARGSAARQREARAQRG